MEEEHFGGLMVVGMKVNLDKVYKVDMVLYLGKEGINNIKDLGIMECLMEKEFNILKMDNALKVHLNKINFMEMVYFIKMILLFMEFGKIMSCQLLIWWSQAFLKNEAVDLIWINH